MAGQISLALADSTYTYRIYIQGIRGTPRATQLTANPVSLSFGGVNVGQSVAKAFTLTNNGNTVTTSLSYTPPSGVTESDNCGQSLAAGASCTVTATYTPTAGSTLAGSFAVSSQDSSTQVALTGTAQDSQLTANPASLSFGTVNVGQSFAQSFTLTNNGKAPTTSLTYTPPPGVTEFDNCGQALAAGASCTVTATYTPTAAGALAGSINVASQDSNAQVALSGTTPTTVARIYVSQPGGSTLLCTLTTNGNLGTCGAASGTASDLYSIAVSGPYAYESTSSTVTVCSIGSGDALSGCSTPLTGLNAAYNLTINNGYLYVTQVSANNVEVCTIGSAGALTGCTTTGTALSEPNAIAFNGNYAYITNYTSSAITSCTVNANGTFSSCATTGASVGTGPVGMAITGNTVYVTGASNEIFKCAVSGLTVSGCTAVVTSGIPTPRNLSIINGVLYVAGYGGNNILAYTIGSTGSLTLLNSVTGLTEPWAITPAP